jgi:capsular polysaccharide transport system ATP-binding protein
MIVFKNLSKRYRGTPDPKIVFDDVDLTMDSTKRVAVLGAKGSGKTTLLHMIAGMELPSSGKIERFTTVSLPIGYQRAFKPTSTCKENILFLARCYGAKPTEIVNFIKEVTELDGELDLPMRAVVPESRVRIVYALGYALPFETYLIDTLPAAGGAEFRVKCLAMLAERAKTSGIIFATGDVRVARMHCESALLISDRKVHYFSDLDEAVWRLTNDTRAAG